MGIVSEPSFKPRNNTPKFILKENTQLTIKSNMFESSGFNEESVIKLPQL